jgi:hypothetical protein
MLIIVEGVVNTSDLTPVNGSAGIPGSPEGATKFIGVTGLVSAAFAGEIVVAASTATAITSAIAGPLLRDLICIFIVKTSLRNVL